MVTGRRTAIGLKARGAKTELATRKAGSLAHGYFRCREARVNERNRARRPGLAHQHGEAPAFATSTCPCNQPSSRKAPRSSQRHKSRRIRAPCQGNADLVRSLREVQLRVRSCSRLALLLALTETPVPKFGCRNLAGPSHCLIHVPSRDASGYPPGAFADDREFARYSG